VLGVALSGERWADQEVTAAKLWTLVAGVAGVAWIAIHYASGFGALEAAALGSAGPISRDVAGRFAGWNVPIHVLHAAVLTVALGALLSVPLTALRRKG